MQHPSNTPDALDPDDIDDIQIHPVDLDGDEDWPLCLAAAVEQRDLAAMRQVLPKASEVVREMTLLSCTSKGFAEGAKLLLQHCPRKDRSNALYQAASNGHADLVSVLLNHVPEDSDHSEALASAVARRHHRVIPILLPHARPDEVVRNLLDDYVPEVDLLAAHVSEPTLRHALDILDADQLPAIAARLASIEQAR